MTADYFTAPGMNMPISIQEMLRRTFRIYLSNIPTILKVAITIFVPAQIIIGIAGKKLLPWLTHIESNLNKEIENDYSRMIHLLSTFLYFILLEIIGCLLYSMAEAPIAEITKNAHAGLAKTTYSEARHTVKEFFPKIFAAIFIISITSSVALCLLIFPGIYLALSWWITCPVIVVEGKGIFDSMSKSRELVSGYRCDLFKIYCAYLLSYVSVVFAINTTLFIFLAPRLVRYIFGYCIPVISFRPLGLVLRSVVYFDLRARKESLNQAKLLVEIRAKKSEGFGIENDVNEGTERGIAEGSSNIEMIECTTSPGWAAQSEPLKMEGTESIWNNQASAEQKYNGFIS